MVKKISNRRRQLLILCLRFIPNHKRAEWLRKKNIFFKIGKGTHYANAKIPSEPYLVSIGENCRIASNVDFITHDIIDGMFSLDPTVRSVVGNDARFRFHLGKIEIGNYVMIGSNSTILYGVKIGSHVIVAAGSVVTHDVEDGTIVGGNPAKVIGNYYDLAKRRSNPDGPTNNNSIEEIIDFYWNKK